MAGELREPYFLIQDDREDIQNPGTINLKIIQSFDQTNYFDPYIANAFYPRRVADSSLNYPQSPAVNRLVLWLPEAIDLGNAYEFFNYTDQVQLVQVGANPVGNQFAMPDPAVLNGRNMIILGTGLEGKEIDYRYSGQGSVISSEMWQDLITKTLTIYDYIELMKNYTMTDVIMRANASQTLPGNTVTKIQLNEVVRDAKGTEADIVNYRITVQDSGFYIFNGRPQENPGAGNDSRFQWWKNGAVLISWGINTSNNVAGSFAWWEYLEAGDYIELYYFNDTSQLFPGFTPGTTVRLTQAENTRLQFI